MAREFFSLPLLLLLLTLITLSSTAAAAAAAVSGGNNNSTEFIRSSCGSTLYPDLCFTSLSRYANAVQKNPVQLALVAAKVTLARLRSTSALVRVMRGSSGREAAALRDCVESLGSAGELTRRSAEEIRRLEVAVGPEVAWRVSNAQTWMSAAITNEETCRDGFDGMVVGPDRTVTVGADVCGRVGRVKEYTSNALALVNSLVNGP